MSNFITVERAIEMTSLYRKQMDTILADDFKGQDVLVKSETFSREQVEKLFANPACKHLRVYYGMDQQRRVHALLVAVDANNEDIITTSLTEGNVLSQDIIEEGDRCPPNCPPSSPLNS
jgi:hypothetical protein